MTNTIGLKITCFLLLFTVLLIKDILDLAWHLATRMKFGTWEQNWDLYETISGLGSQLGPSPKFGTSLRALFLLFGFFPFRDKIFRNRDFFPRPNFFETETETFFPKRKPKPSKIWQKFRNRNVNFCLLVGLGSIYSSVSNHPHSQPPLQQSPQMTVTVKNLLDADHWHSLTLFECEHLKVVWIRRGSTFVLGLIDCYKVVSFVNPPSPLEQL